MRKIWNIAFALIDWCASIYTIWTFSRIQTEKSLTDHSFQEERHSASLKLAELVPYLLDSHELPYTIGGLPSWLQEYCEESGGFLPSIDLVFPTQQLAFVFVPEVPHDSERLDTTPHEDSKLLLADCIKLAALRIEQFRVQQAIARRLYAGVDGIPILPLFCTPDDVLCARTLDELAFTLNIRWQETIQWALRQIPPVPTDLHRRPASDRGVGTWVNRRFWLTEAQSSALFPLGHNDPPATDAE